MIQQEGVRRPFCDAPHLCAVVTAVVLGVLATVALTQFHLVGASYYAAYGVISLSAVVVVVTGTHWVCGKRNRDQNLPPPSPELLIPHPPSAGASPVERGDDRHDEEETFETPPDTPPASTIRTPFFEPINPEHERTDSGEESVSPPDTPVSTRSNADSPNGPVREGEPTTGTAVGSNMLLRALGWGREKLGQAASSTFTTLQAGGSILSELLRFEGRPAEARSLEEYRQILRNQPVWLVPLNPVEPQEGASHFELTCYINGEPIPLDIPDRDIYTTIEELGPLVSVLSKIRETAETENTPDSLQKAEKIQRAIEVIRQANNKYCLGLTEITVMGGSALFTPLTSFVNDYFGNSGLNVRVVPYLSMGTEEYPHGCCSHLMDVIKDEDEKPIAVKLYVKCQLHTETEILGYLEAKMGVDLTNRRGGMMVEAVQEEPSQRFSNFEMSDVMHFDQF